MSVGAVEAVEVGDLDPRACSPHGATYLVTPRSATKLTQP
jgi:hypothetical protein